MNQALNYHNVHVWIYRHYGSAKKCTINEQHFGRIEWANIDGVYEKDIKHFVELCRHCHILLDKRNKHFSELKGLDIRRNSLLNTWDSSVK